MDVSEKIKEVNELNAKYNEEIKLLVEQRSEIDRKISSIREECFRQQGEVRVLKSLEDKPNEVPPNKVN